MDMPAYEFVWQVSTHSRPKAAGSLYGSGSFLEYVSTHSRPKAAGPPYTCTVSDMVFQHTAARRRLVQGCFSVIPACFGFNTQPPEGGWFQSRLKSSLPFRFNTQPPEGGWAGLLRIAGCQVCFNTQPPEGGWVPSVGNRAANSGFQHTAARRRLVLRLPTLRV